MIVFLIVENKQTGNMKGRVVLWAHGRKTGGVQDQCIKMKNIILKGKWEQLGTQCRFCVPRNDYKVIECLVLN